MEIYINESDGKTYLNGLISEADVRNGNKRLYPASILKPAILDLARRVSEGPVYTEREHPNRIEVDESLACGVILEVKWNELKKNARCKVQVLEHTSAGMKLLSDIKAGVKVGISTRGRGSMNSDKVIESITFMTADIVSIPSCQNCWLSESVGELMPNDFIMEYDISGAMKIQTERTLKDMAILQAFENTLGRR